MKNETNSLLIRIFIFTAIFLSLLYFLISFAFNQLNNTQTTTNVVFNFKDKTITQNNYEEIISEANKYLTKEENEYFTLAIQEYDYFDSILSYTVEEVIKDGIEIEEYEKRNNYIRELAKKYNAIPIEVLYDSDYDYVYQYQDLLDNQKVCIDIDGSAFNTIYKLSEEKYIGYISYTYDDFLYCFTFSKNELQKIEQINQSSEQYAYLIINNIKTQPLLNYLSSQGYEKAGEVYTYIEVENLNKIIISGDIEEVIF